MASVRVWLVGGVVGIAAAVGFGQQPQGGAPTAAQPVPTLKTTVRIVELDVVAVDAHGQPVKGLKASDLVLSEDGVPQALQSFTERDAAADQPAQPPMPVLPPNTFANHAPVVNNTAMTVLLFDTSGLNSADAAYARDEAAAYLKKVKPGTPMCVFDLDQWDGLRLIQDFTTDSAALRSAVESKANEQKPKQFPEFTPVLQRGVAMRELAHYLAGFTGRKNLIWFTGNSAPPAFRVGGPRGLFPDTLTYSDEDFRKDMEGAASTLTLNGFVMYIVDPRGVIFRWNLEENIEEQNEIFFEGADAQKAAAATGGKAYYNSNAIDKDVAQIVAAGSHYYTVSYAPTNTVWDGAYRKLRVRFASSATSTGVPTAKLRLQYRDGYYAQETPPPSASGRQVRRLISYSPLGAPKSAPLSDAMQFGAVAPFEVLFQVHITPEATVEKIKHDAKTPAGNYLTAQWLHKEYRNYAIHYSVDPEDVQFVQGSDGMYHDTIEFVAVLYDNYDHVVNSFINTVPVAVGATDYAEIQKTGLGIEVPMAVPTRGDFYLRLGVHDVNSGHVGALEVSVREIEVGTPADTLAAAKGH